MRQRRVHHEDAASRALPRDGEGPGQWTDPALVENGKEARPRGLLNHDQSFVPYLCEPRLSGVLEALLGPHYLAQDCGAAAGIGTRRRGLHCDWPYNQDDDRMRTEPLVRREVYDGLPSAVKPLYRHWVES